MPALRFAFPALLLAAASCTAPALADAPGRADIFAPPDYREMKFSPDGRQVAMLRPQHGVTNVWVAPLSDLTQAVQLTHFDDRGADALHWSADGRYILVEKDIAGEEDTQIHAVDVAARTVLDLTRDGTVQAHLIRSAAGGRALIAENDRDPRYSDVYLVDLKTGARRTVLRNEAHYTSFVADQDLHVRVAGRVNPEDGSTTWFDLGGAEPRPFMTVPLADLRNSRVLGLHGAGTLRMISSRDSDLANLVDIDIATGAMTMLARAGQADIVDVLSDGRTGTILATAEDPLVTHWTARDATTGADLDALRAKLGAGFAIDDETADGRTWLVREVPAQGPERYYLWDRTARALRLLASTRSALEGRAMPRTVPITFRARDGLPITGYLTLPAGLSFDRDPMQGRPIPLVLNVHGGPWLRNSYEFEPTNVWLATQGYAALSVNFRGSFGFGKHFMQIADHQWSQTMHDDLLDAVHWAVAQGITTSDRTAIWGLSYGGYSTLVGLSFTPDTFRCGVDIAGPSNLATLQDGAPDWWAWQRSQFALRMGDSRTPQGRQDLLARSPLIRASQVIRPLLIAQGLNDPRVHPSQSIAMAQALQAQDKPVTLLLYPDEGHVFEKTATEVSFHAIAEHFLARCLGGTAQPYGRALAGSGVQVPIGADRVPGLAQVLETK
jgi:dipeptidyl aminopeptidase/acylaminoacyl peptidase